jgi:protein-S-isoprenylcysteine O-methyltransferase Ste14
MQTRHPGRLLSALELKMSPVMTTVLLAALMWLLAGSTPGLTLPPVLRWALSLVCFGAGAAIGAAGVWGFRRARTTVNPWRPHASSTLVVNGIYRYTRNPMYLGLLLALLGWGLYLANVYALILAFTFVPYMSRFQIRPEERALRQTFGQQFRGYCGRVRRWL